MGAFAGAVLLQPAPDFLTAPQLHTTGTARDHTANTTTFDFDYTLNGAVLYPAGVPVPTTEHTRQLIADGVAGTTAGPQA